MYLIVFSIIFLTTVTNVNTKTIPCDNESCSGPYKLRDLFVNTNYTKNRNINEDIVILEYTSEMKIIEKEKFQLYCYNGGALDYNTGCIDMSKKYYANVDELAQQKCIITEKMPPGKFWGSDAKNCFKKEDRVVNNSDFEYYGWNGEAPFAYHMCVTDWKCKTKKTNINLFLGQPHNIYTYLRNGTQISLFNSEKIPFGNEFAITKRIELEPGFTAFVTANIRKIVYNYEASCFENRAMNSTICNIKNCGKKEFIGRTFFYKGYERFAKFDNGFIAIPRMVNGYAYRDMHEDINKAGSIEDIKGVQSEIIYLAEETHHNIEFINMHINILHNKMNNIIKSVGKIDDELIPNIMGKKGKTKWNNKDLFTICPCFDDKITEDVNCNGDFIFYNGRIKYKKDSDNKYCAKYDVKNIKEIDFFIDNDNIVINELINAPLNGTVSDWDGWSWLSSQKEYLNDYINFSSSISGSFNILQILDDNSALWKKFSFVFSTSFLTYLNTVVILLIILFRK